MVWKTVKRMYLNPTMTQSELKPYMTYEQWCHTLGKYRWYHEDGSPRLYYPLAYEWERIYKTATEDADNYFKTRNIYDPSIFTSQFMANVPINWMKFKTQLEMFSGTLDGTNIDPEIFEAGFDRKLTSTNTEQSTQDYKENSTYTQDINSGSKDNSTTNANATTNQTTNSEDVIGSREDNTSIDRSQDTTTDTTENSKGRNINYIQGLQAYSDRLDNGNIGELGTDYASNFSDDIREGTRNQTENQTGTETTNFEQGEQTNTSRVEGNSSAKSETTEEKTNESTQKIVNNAGNTNNMENSGKSEYDLKETVRRINYYDNLAFLRERYDRLENFVPFYSYFEPYFASVESFNPAW